MGNLSETSVVANSDNEDDDLEDEDNFEDLSENNSEITLKGGKNKDDRILGKRNQSENEQAAL